VLKSILSVVYRWRKMVSMAIRCWFKVQSWLLLHYYVLRRLCILCNTYHDCWGHRLSLIELIFYIWQLLYMYNVQENIRIFIITLLARLYMNVGILLTCGKYLGERIISL